MKHFVVGTMGKVGTTSLRRSLKQLPEVRAYKTHFLSARDLSRDLRKKMRDTGKQPAWAVESRDFLQQHGLQGDDTVLVTPVREIVGRNISGFFQRHRQFGMNPPFEDVDIRKVIDVFNKDFGHRRPDNWFKQEYEEKVGISLDDIDFDPEKGYFIGNVKGINLFLLQIELGDKFIARLFSSNYDIDFRMKRVNDSRRKVYADLISRFKQEFTLDEKLCDELMNTRYMQKFYSPRQRDHIVAFYRRQVPTLVPLPR